MWFQAASGLKRKENMKRDTSFVNESLIIQEKFVKPKLIIAKTKSSVRKVITRKERSISGDLLLQPSPLCFNSIMGNKLY